MYVVPIGIHKRPNYTCLHTIELAIFLSSSVLPWPPLAKGGHGATH